MPIKKADYQVKVVLTYNGMDMTMTFPLSETVDPMEVLNDYKSIAAGTAKVQTLVEKIEEKSKGTNK